MLTSGVYFWSAGAPNNTYGCLDDALMRRVPQLLDGLPRAVCTDNAAPAPPAAGGQSWCSGVRTGARCTSHSVRRRLSTGAGRRPADLVMPTAVNHRPRQPRPPLSPPPAPPRPSAFRRAHTETGVCGETVGPVQGNSMTSHAGHRAPELPSARGGTHSACQAREHAE